jgi:ribosomal protein S18 acetylase RimI-like enzyme
MTKIVNANTDDLIAKMKKLFYEYAESLGFDLSFQNFKQEMENFPVQYSPPSGCLFVALSGNNALGCVGLRSFDNGICEMKRLYVKPEARGQKIGRALAESIISAATEIGYEHMRLDTIPTMVGANRLYKTLGFQEIQPYRYNPIEGTIYLELNLKRL